MAEHPAEVMRRAARLLRKRAGAATPGPWERPLDTRHKDFIGAALPEDEEPRTWQGGIIPESFGQYKGYQYRYAGQRERVCVVQCPTDSLGDHARKRGGRDLEYIAAMHPPVALALAGWLEQEAGRAERTMIPHEDGLWCLWCGGVYGRNCGCWDGALAVAREILGEQEGGI